MPDLIAIPLYEPVIMGNPFYIYIIVFLIAGLALGIIAFKTEVFDPMQPVWGFRAAARKKGADANLAIVVGMNGKLWMETIEHISNIFSSMALPLKWIITVPVVGQFGRVNTSFVCDDWNIVHNLDNDYAIVEAINKWNSKVELTNILIKKADGTDTEELDLIYDWTTFEKHLMDGSLDDMFPEGIQLPPLRVVNFHEVRRYLPKWNAAHHAGYINQEVAKRLEKEDKEGKTLLTFALIAGAIMVVCAALCYAILTLVK